MEILYHKARIFSIVKKLYIVCIVWYNDFLEVQTK